MEETTSRYRVQLQIYRISSRGQPTGGGPPVWGLGEGLTTPTLKNHFVIKPILECRIWADFLSRPKMVSEGILGRLAGGGVVQLAPDRNRWRDLVNAVMSLRILAPVSCVKAPNYNRNGSIQRHSARKQN
jgi:hypothetical protein